MKIQNSNECSKQRNAITSDHDEDGTVRISMRGCPSGNAVEETIKAADLKYWGCLIKLSVKV